MVTVTRPALGYPGQRRYNRVASFLSKMFFRSMVAKVYKDDDGDGDDKVS